MTVVIVDTKAEYRRLGAQLQDKMQVLGVAKAEPLLFNPLQPPQAVEPEVWAPVFADVFTRSYGLSEPSRRMIMDCLLKLHLGTQGSAPRCGSWKMRSLRSRPGARGRRTAGAPSKTACT